MVFVSCLPLKPSNTGVVKAMKVCPGSCVLSLLLDFCSGVYGSVKFYQMSGISRPSQIHCCSPTLRPFPEFSSLSQAQLLFVLS